LFPIPDLGVVNDDAHPKGRSTDTYDAVTATIEQALERGSVYVHCWGGIGRTGTVVGCVLADVGLGYDEIIERLATLRKRSRKERRQAFEMPCSTKSSRGESRHGV
jgi:protein-tyrosine phosphatase